MKHKLIIIIGLLLSTSAILAQNPLEKKAAELYASKDYEGAVSVYEELLQSGVSTDLYYNFANSLFKSGELGRAILYYERALVLNPSNEDAVASLDFANTQITDKIDINEKFFVVEWVSVLGKIFDTNRWAYLSITLFLTAIILVLIFLFNRNIVIRKTSFFVGIFCFVMSMISFLYAFSQKKYLQNNPFAIVMDGSVSVKSSPSVSGKELFVLHEGTKIEVISSNNDWNEISLPDGKVGWVKAETVEGI